MSRGSDVARVRWSRGTTEAPRAPAGIPDWSDARDHADGGRTDSAGDRDQHILRLQRRHCSQRLAKRRRSRSCRDTRRPCWVLAPPLASQPIGEKNGPARSAPVTTDGRDPRTDPYCAHGGRVLRGGREPGLGAGPLQVRRGTWQVPIEPPARFRSRPACEACIGGHPGDRERQHGGSEIGNGKLTRSGVLHAHGKSQRDDQEVANPAGPRAAGQRDGDQRDSGQGGPGGLSGQCGYVARLHPVGGEAGSLPNLDAMYWFAAIDRARGPSIVQVPDFGGRFCVYQVCRCST